MDWRDPTPAGVYGQTMNEGHGVMGLDNSNNSEYLLGAVAGISVAKQWGVGVYGDASLAGPGSYAGRFAGDVLCQDNIYCGKR